MKILTLLHMSRGAMTVQELPMPIAAAETASVSPMREERWYRSVPATRRTGPSCRESRSEALFYRT